MEPKKKVERISAQNTYIVYTMSEELYAYFNVRFISVTGPWVFGCVCVYVAFSHYGVEDIRGLETANSSCHMQSTTDY